MLDLMPYHAGWVAGEGTPQAVERYTGNVSHDKGFSGGNRW